jgi:hypothetical protein
MTHIASAHAPPVGPALRTPPAASGEAFSPTGSLGPLVQAYVTGDLPGAIALTFVVNLVLGSAVVLTLPSAVVPFAGILWWHPIFGRSQSRWSAWRHGALLQVRVYALVAALLALAATYEAMEVIWILPAFSG